MATRNWLTQNVRGLAEYLTGDPKAPGFREDHGGSNYHDHFAFLTKEQAREAKEYLEQHGIIVTGIDDKSGHAPNSFHYTGQAFDVPGHQWGKGTDPEVFAGSKKVRELLLKRYGAAGGSPGKPAPEAAPPGAPSGDAPSGDDGYREALRLAQRQSLDLLRSEPVRIEPIGLPAGAPHEFPGYSPREFVGTPAAAAQPPILSTRTPAGTENSMGPVAFNPISRGALSGTSVQAPVADPVREERRLRWQNFLMEELL